MKKESLPELIAEIKDELRLLEKLVFEIQETGQNIPQSPREQRIYEESLALKLHNFYTGYERIFQKIAGDINGNVPTSPDWHKRLLRSMTLDIENIRPPVLSHKTEKALSQYLAFRHVVRNIYGFEIDSEKLSGLVQTVANTYQEVNNDLNRFLHFLREMSS